MLSLYGVLFVGIAYTKQRRENHENRIPHGASHSVLIQLCRVIRFRMVEPYCSQSLLDEYCLLLNTSVFRGL